MTSSYPLPPQHPQDRPYHLQQQQHHYPHHQHQHQQAYQPHQQAPQYQQGRHHHEHQYQQQQQQRPPHPNVHAQKYDYRQQQPYRAPPPHPIAPHLGLNQGQSGYPYQHNQATGPPQQHGPIGAPPDPRQSWVAGEQANYNQPSQPSPHAPYPNAQYGGSQYAFPPVYPQHQPPIPAHPHSRNSSYEVPTYPPQPHPPPPLTNSYQYPTQIPEPYPPYGPPRPPSRSNEGIHNRAGPQHHSDAGAFHQGSSQNGYIPPRPHSIPTSDTSIWSSACAAVVSARNAQSTPSAPERYQPPAQHSSYANQSRTTSEHSYYSGEGERSRSGDHRYDVTHSRSKQFGGQNRGEGKAVYHPHEKDPPNLYARLQAEISSSDASSFAADTFSSVVGNNLPAVESDDIAMDDDARMESASDNDSDVDITGNSTPLHRMSDVGNDVDAAGDTDEEALTKEKENAFDVFGGRPKYSEVSAAPARHEYEKAADCKLPSKSCAPKKRKVSEAKSAKRPKQPRKASVSTEKAMPDDFKPEMLYATDDLQMWARKRKRIDYAAMSKGIGRAEKARDVGIDGNGRKSDSRGRSSRASPDGLATPLNGRAGVAQPRSTKSTMPTCACGEPTTGVGARENEFCIGCEGCDVWFHGRCVGVPDAPTADAYAKWVCSACFAKGERSSWKLMCRADGCDGWAEVEVEDPLADVPNGAGDDAPLPLASKFENLPRRYCSSTCGRRAAKAIRNTIQIPTRPRPPPTEETINANMFARLSTWQAVQAAEVIDRAKLDKLQSEKASVKRWVHALELRRRRIREAIAACLALNGVSEEDMHKGDDGQVDHEGGGQAGTYNITVAPEDRICGFDARIVAEWVVDEPDHGDEGCDEEWSKVKTDDSWKEKPSMVNGHDGEAPLDEVRVSEVQGQDHRAVAPDRARDIDTPESAKSRPFRAEIVQHSNGDASDAMLIDTSAESSIRSGADKEKSQDGDAHEGDAIAIHRPSPSVANGVISTKCVAAQPVECDDGSRSVTGDLPAHQTPASEREREGDGMAVDGTALAEEAGKMNLPSHVVSADAHQPISGHDVALGNGDATLQPSSDSLQIVARSSAEDKVVHAQTSPSETDPMDIVAPDKPLVEGTSHDGPDKNGSEAIPSADKQHEALVSGPSHPPSLSHHPSDMPTSPADPSPQHDQPPPPLCTHTGKCPLHEDWERLKWREVELELQTALARLDGLRKTGTPAVWRSLRRRREV